MQALSIWPSRIDFRLVPKSDMEVSRVGSSCILGTSIVRRKRWDFRDSGCQCRRSGLILVSSCLRDRKSRKSGACFGSSQLDMRCRVFDGGSEVDVCFFSEPKKGRFLPCVALALTLGGQTTESQFVKEDSVSVDGISGKNDSSDNVDGNGNEELHSSENGKEELDSSAKGKGSENRKLGKEKKKERIDVRLLGGSLRSARTVEDVEEVLKEKGELPLQVYSTIIRAFGKEKRLESAIALVQWLKEKKKDTNGSIGPNLFIYNSLLGAMKESGQLEEAEKVVNEMATEGMIPNVVTYNTLMGIYILQGKEVEALNLFEEIQKKGVSPSPASYSTALLAYRRMEDGFGALKFFVELREKYRNKFMGEDPVHVDWGTEYPKLEDFTIRICYQVMRRWLIKSGNLCTDVLKLLAEMDRVGLRTGRSEYERLVWACTTEDHYIVARELYYKIRERNSEISLSVCNHVIWLLGKAKKWWAALEIYEDLLDKGPKPNNMSYELVVSHFNILLTAASRRGIWKWGISLLNKMELKGLKPGSREWNAVLLACSKASETSAAVQTFQRMVERGVKPTIVSYGALLSALEKGKHYDEAQLVWESMMRLGVEPNVHAYTIMASVYTAQGKMDLVDTIIDKMASSGIEISVITYNAIISACARSNMSATACEWFDKMKAPCISPNEVTYEMLIQVLTNDGKAKLAYDFYLRARKEGLNLSSKAYDSVIDSAEIHGATIDVNILGPRPPENKKLVMPIGKNLTEFRDLADVPQKSQPFVGKELHTRQTDQNL